MSEKAFDKIKAGLDEAVIIAPYITEIETLRKRIAELERPLCIGETTIRILAKEGAKVFEDGRGLVAADELFKQDPYERIAELEALLNDCIKIAEDHEGCQISHIEGMSCEAGEQIADKIREKISGQPVDAPNQDPVLIRKRCEALIIAMVGKELATQWWNNPNKAFNGDTPEQMYSVEPTKVYAYLMSRAEGEW